MLWRALPLPLWQHQVPQPGALPRPALPEEVQGGGGSLPRHSPASTKGPADTSQDETEEGEEMGEGGPENSSQEEKGWEVEEAATLREE